MAVKKTTTASKTTATKTTTTRTRKTPVKKAVEKVSPSETSFEIRKVDNGFIVEMYSDNKSETSVFLDTSTTKMVKYLTDTVGSLY